MTQEKEMIKKMEEIPHKHVYEIKHEESIENLELIDKPKKVSYFKLLFKFANKLDIFLIFIAIIGSLIAGAAMPLISLLLGSAINNFGPDVDKADLYNKVTVLAINYTLCGIGILIGSFIMVFFWTIISKRLIHKINIEYFQVLLRQEQAFFDQGKKNEHFVTKINQEIQIIENGVNFNLFKFI